MKGVLIRVGIDSTSGEWNSPVDPTTKDFVYVPIPEEEKDRPVHTNYTIDYSQFVIPCENLGVTFPQRLLSKNAHLDPDFRHLTYGDQKNRGKPLFSLREGDIAAFYSAMSPTKPCNHEKIYALIGLFEVDSITRAKSIPPEDRYKNAHTRRKNDDTDIVILGRTGTSGRLAKCIPIGEFRNHAYRITEELLNLWGRLSVNDGWIQRSAVLPWFCEPERFYSWFKKQNTKLLARNN